VLVLIMVAGVLIRQFFILRHKGVVNVVYPIVAVALLAGVAAWIAPSKPAAAGPASAAAPAVDVAQVKQLVDKHCIQCHAAKPTLMPTPAKGLMFDQTDQIKAHAQQIYQQVVVQKAMPLGNMTNMTEDERALIGRWFESGAK